MHRFDWKLWDKRLKTYCLYSKLRFFRREIQTRLLSASSFKDLSGPFPDKYNPEDVEKGWYEWWQQHRLFQPNADQKGETFSMVFPPPNVTGDLHLGHAFTVAIQDSLVRWRRAKGDNVVWVPGFDHAGIATQVVIEKKLKAETGKQRHEISKEEFIQHANTWKDRKIETIAKQLQSLGASLDWTRQCFTLDQNFERSVVEAFVRLHEEGLISRRKSLVNWCCHLQSAISDIEVENVSVKGGQLYKIPSSDILMEVGKMYHFAYPLHNSGEELVVATGRPETLFGDVAVAVHPADRRFAHLVGSRVVHPFDGRLLPVIGDDCVDPQYGSGCLKITPAHDHNDFEVGQRHNLSLMSVLDSRGNLIVNFHPFQGLSRFVARKKVVSELKRLGLFRKEEEIDTKIPVCSRSGDIVEPMLKTQWYLDCDLMTSRLVQRMNDGELNVEPESSRTTLLTWLGDKRKWCVSRQLWWGHQIPAYSLSSEAGGELEENWIVARSEKEAADKFSSKLNRNVSFSELQRDEDVLDTWFSSSLFPFAAFGWPTKDFNSIGYFYPLSLMETGFDIIFFWVARMAMLGEQLTGRLPFSRVLVHGLLCDTHGRKMSKSLGNVIDPRDIQRGISLQMLCEKSEKLCSEGYITKEELKVARKSLAKDFPNGIQPCGADAIRFALLSQDIKGQFINVDVGYVESCKPFCNKIWQGCRFFLSQFDRLQLPLKTLDEVSERMGVFDRWVVSRLSSMVVGCDAAFSTSDLHLVTAAVRKFWVATLCDVYLEGVKPLLSLDQPIRRDEQEVSLSVLRCCVETCLVTLAPLMPFLAEELFQRLKARGVIQSALLSVSQLPYPSSQQWARWVDPGLERSFDEVTRVAALLRQVKIKYGIGKAKPFIYVVTSDEERLGIFEACREQLESLGGCQVAKVTIRTPETLTKSVKRELDKKLSLHIELLGLVDMDQCLSRLRKSKQETEQKIAQLNQELQKENLSHNKFININNKIKSVTDNLIEIEKSILELS